VIVLWLLRPFDDRISRAKMLWPLMLAGTFSYSLYLTHMLFLPVILARMTRLGFDGSLYWITLLSAIVITMILGWAFYSVVESHFISSRQKRRMESELSGVLSAGQPSQNKF
jgi:peptidoglycan/LPS O-acetylase OafA/YrhL